MSKKYLGVITPDSYEIREKILGMIENKKFEIIKQETVLLRNEDIELVYSDLKDDPVWPDLLIAVKKGPVLVFVLKKKVSIWSMAVKTIRKMPILNLEEEKKPVEELQELIGHVDSDKTTIRGKFAHSRAKHAIYINISRCEETINHFFENGN
jgi:nucleoside diphosphate kinase